MKKHRRVMSQDTEGWYNVWRKTNTWFKKWHEEFGEFSPNHSKAWKFHFEELFLAKVYEVWDKKIQRSYKSWHWTVMQNLNKPWSCSFKIGITNWVKFHLSTQSLEKLYNDGWTLFVKKHKMFQLENFRVIMCHDTVGWFKI